MVKQLRLIIQLQQPVRGVVYGLQKGKGIDYETIQKHLSDGSDISFEFQVQLKPGKDQMLSLYGPFVHGTSDGRFVYIDIGTAAGQRDSVWSRRLKIPLAGIVEQIAASTDDCYFDTAIPGTGKDGTPCCGTVKPFNGWNCVMEKH
jgi:hypothetical protein